MTQHSPSGDSALSTQHCSVTADDLALALRVLVHESLVALTGLRPVLEALLTPGAATPAAGDAVARLSAIESTLGRVAAVYRRRIPLHAQLDPGTLAALVRAATLPGNAPPAETPVAAGPEEVEIALRVLVHEVGNALQAIKPLIDILHHRPEYLWGLPPAAREAGARLALERLVDTVQVLEQIGDLRPRLAPVRLADVVAAVARECAASRKDAGHGALRVRVSPKLCVLADALWLRHSLRNLVDNALRAATPAGRVTISARRNKPGVALSVADTGPGLSQDELDYVFHADLDARTQLRRPLAPAGTGIGLSLVRYWVRAMGGTIDASSHQAPTQNSKLKPQNSSGTTVTISLPEAPDAPAA
jgi:signal transduction histidine kinase